MSGAGEPSWATVVRGIAVPVTVLDADGRALWSNGAPPASGTARHVDHVVLVDGRRLTVRTTVPIGDEDRSGRVDEHQPVAGIDTDRLEGLLADLASPELAGGVIDAFLDQLDERIDAIESSDAWARRCASDALQSTALLVGAHELAAACTRVAQGAEDVPVRAAANRAADELRGWRLGRGLPIG